MKKHSIELTQEQRAELTEIIRKGQASARKMQHAHILLKIDSGEHGPDWSDKQVQEAFGIGATTIWRIRQRFLAYGLSDALNRRPQPERPEKRKLDGEQEAHLLALTCSQAPEGYTRWSLRLIAEKFVEWGYVEQISHQSIWVALKKMSSNPG